MHSHTAHCTPGKIIIAVHQHHPYASARACYDCILRGVKYTQAGRIFDSEINAGLIGDIILVRLDCREKRSPAELVHHFSAHPYVVHAEPCYALKNHVMPNDPYFPTQWGLQNTLTPGAWDYTTGYNEVVVGILDSGIDASHPDIVGNLWVSPEGTTGWNFHDENSNTVDITGHGTFVAGIAGGVGNNGLGIAGVCWQVRLAALKIGDVSFSMSAAIAAIHYANTHNIPVLNNSWGGPYDSPILKHAICQYRGLFVVSAGNTGADNDAIPDFPGNFDCENIISVAATDRDDKHAAFSNYGAKNVDISAPGVDIISTALHGEYSTRCGSSLSAPYVAGAAALLKSYAPHISAKEMKRIILSTASVRPQLTGKTQTGGILDVQGMLAAIN